jgi:hypothetical protein
MDRNEIRNAISVFYVDQTDKLKSDTRRHRPTPETQDGGRQTGSTRISRSVMDRNETRDTIPIFSMSAKPVNTILTPAESSDTGNARRRITAWLPPSCIFGVGLYRRISE